MRHGLRGLILAVPLLAAACAGPRPVLGEGVGAMRTSLAAVKTGSGETFTDINATRREDAIAEVLDSGDPPSEAAFATVIDTDTVQRWNGAFDTLDDYLGALQDLVDPKRSAVTVTNLNAIGTALQSEAIGATIPKGAQGLFAALGGAIVQAAAEGKAQAVMRRTDASFNSLMRRLANLVAGPGEGTLAAMVTTQWQRKLDDIAADQFSRQASRAEREVAVRAYASALDKRDAELARLANLRESLLALGEAHTAAANNTDGAVLYWVAQMNQRLKDARAGAGGD